MALSPVTVTVEQGDSHGSMENYFRGGLAAPLFVSIPPGILLILPDVQ